MNYFQKRLGIVFALAVGLAPVYLTHAGLRRRR